MGVKEDITGSTAASVSARLKTPEVRVKSFSFSTFTRLLVFSVPVFVLVSFAFLRGLTLVE